MRYPTDFVMVYYNSFSGLFDDQDLPVFTRVIFLMMRHMEYESGLVYLTAADIMRELGVARSSVDDAIALLARKALITRVNGRGNTKHFRMSPTFFRKGKRPVRKREHKEST